MRLDKYLVAASVATRRETARAVRAGEVTVNGTPARRADAPVDPETDTVCFRGAPVRYKRYRYILMHKPDGVVSATEDGRDKTVLDLLPPALASGLFPCGRLDKHTTGLLLLTNDGELAHRLLSPRRHVEKRYRFTVREPLGPEACARFAEGLVLEDGYTTKPALLVLDPGGLSGEITLTEGKYHQIKRMMESLGNRITSLQRISFGPLALPPDLPSGGYRELTPGEEAALRRAGGGMPDEQPGKEP